MFHVFHWGIDSNASGANQACGVAVAFRANVFPIGSHYRTLSAPSQYQGRGGALVEPLKLSPSFRIDAAFPHGRQTLNLKLGGPPNCPKLSQTGK